MRVKPGFTLTELVIVIGIVLTLLTLTTSVSLSSITQSQVGSATATLIADLRATQAKAMAGATPGSTSIGGWGIYFESDRYTIFPGTTYLPGGPSNTTVYLPDNVVVSATTSTLVFANPSGALYSPPPSDPVITLTAGGSVNNIQVNSWGLPNVDP